MTIEIFLAGLTICSLFTGLVTQAVKKMLQNGDKKYNSNIIAAICSVIVAVITAAAYILICGVTVTIPLITCCVLLIILSWLCAMVGYDKVMQTIQQIITKK